MYSEYSLICRNSFSKNTVDIYEFGGLTGYNHWYFIYNIDTAIVVD